MRTLLIGSWLIASLVPVPLAFGAPAIQRLDDAQLAARVKTVLVNDAAVGPSPITVTVTGGVVTLSGEVRSSELAERAVALARSVPGVVDVTSDLVVVADPQPTWEIPPRFAAIPEPEVTLPPPTFAVGMAVTFVDPAGSALDGKTGYGPLFRLTSRPGFAPAVGFNWYQTGILNGAPASDPLARLRVRPVMGGVAYNVLRGPTVSSLSIVGGYAFNSLGVDEGPIAERRPVSVTGSLAWRAGGSIWYDVSPRIGLNLFVGYVVTRPEVTFNLRDNSTVKSTVKADALLISIGAAYRIF